MEDYIKYNGHNIQPMQIFLSGSGGTCKSHLVKVIYVMSYPKHCFVTAKT